MPCDGVAVMQANLAASAEETVKLLQSCGLRTVVKELDKEPGFLILTNVAGLPVKVKVTPRGIIAITTSGTFAQGREALTQIIVRRLQAQGVDISNLRFEQHRHDGVAPKLAYTTSQSQ